MWETTKMEYEYDKIKYLELLKQYQSLKKKGIWFYKEDRDRYLELLNYKVQLSDHKYWENRKKYFSVMNSFINGKLTADDFTYEFLYLWKKDRDAFDGDTLDIDFEPNIRSKKFSKWMCKVFDCCEVFEPEAQKNEQYGEKWLKDSVSNLLIQIQKEYNFN